MTVQTTTNRIVYSGNGATTIFTYNFKVLDQTHLKVYVDTVLQTLTTDYTVTGVGDPTGGTVVFTSPPSAGSNNVLLVRTVPVNQLVATIDNDTIFSSVFDTAIDKLTMIAQQLNTNSSRTIALADSDPVAGPLILPVTRANKYLQFDANGDPTAVDSQITTVYYGPFASAPATRPDGSARVAGDLYFNTSTNVIQVWTGSAWSNALPTANISLINFAETSSTSKTTFTITGGYTPGLVTVYLNGVLLEPTEYTATNGTTVVLVTACAINDDFRLIGFGNFVAANALAMSLNLSDLPNKATARSNLGLSNAVVSIVETVITTLGAGVWTKPANLVALEVEAVGGGGGGGGVDGQGASTCAVGSGGGAGGYFRHLFAAADLSATENYSVGAAGVAGTPSVAGGDGGPTTFKSFTANGGTGGGSHTASASVGFSPTSRGNGGTVTGSPSVAVKGKSATGWTRLSGVDIIPAVAADTFFGVGGLQIIGSNPGNDATGYGAGGGGACVNGVVTNFNGGAGAQGLLILREYRSAT